MTSDAGTRVGFVISGIVFVLALGPLHAAWFSKDATAATHSSGNGLPDKWPSDAPTYPGGNVNYSGFSSEGETGGNMAVILDAPDNMQKVAEFYKRSLPEKGWKIISETTMGDSTVLAAQKGGKTYSIALVGSGEHTQITSGIADQ